MPQGNPKPGELYLHFKQNMYQIVTVARHSETGEELVIYQALYGTYRTYARPLTMFVSLVDTEKYPKATQKYRFQLVEQQEESVKPVQELERKDAKKAALKPEQAVSSVQGQKKPAVSAVLGQEEAMTPDAKMMAFFDADTIEEKYQILITMSEGITNHMINNMAVVLDLVINDGPVEMRFEELKHCLRTMQQYESTRLR